MPGQSISRREALAGVCLSAQLLNAQARSSSTRSSATTAFRNVTVIDGTGAVLEDHTVAIKDDRIVNSGPAA